MQRKVANELSKQNSKVLASPFISRQKNPQKQNKFYEILASNLQRTDQAFSVSKKCALMARFIYFQQRWYDLRLKGKCIRKQSLFKL